LTQNPHFFHREGFNGDSFKSPPRKYLAVKGKCSHPNIYTNAFSLLVYQRKNIA
jgi:hypothetical protein